jgi:hypothetical protein
MSALVPTAVTAVPGESARSRRETRALYRLRQQGTRKRRLQASLRKLAAPAAESGSPPRPQLAGEQRSRQSLDSAARGKERDL